MNMLWFAISCGSLFIISITMFARANDLRLRPGYRWKIRLAGFVLAGVMPIGIAGTELATHVWPSPYEALFRFGLMLVFLTTPYLPPWHKWIFRDDTTLDGHHK